jgi:hypothetical protein
MMALPSQSEAIEMTTPLASATAMFLGATSHMSKGPATRAYRTKTSFVAVHFDQAGKGKLLFLPRGATLRLIGPSFCLREGFEVMFEGCLYNVFEIDLLARSTPLFERVPAEGRAAEACAYPSGGA